MNLLEDLRPISYASSVDDLRRRLDEARWPKALLEERVCITDSIKGHPLHLAAAHGQVEWVAALLEFGADPCALTDTGLTAFHLVAALANDVDAFNCATALVKAVNDTEKMATLLTMPYSACVYMEVRLPLLYSLRMGHRLLPTVLISAGSPLVCGESSILSAFFLSLGRSDGYDWAGSFRALMSAIKGHSDSGRCFSNAGLSMLHRAIRTGSVPLVSDYLAAANSMGVISACIPNTSALGTVCVSLLYHDFLTAPMPVSTPAGTPPARAAAAARTAAQCGMLSAVLAAVPASQRSAHLLATITGVGFVCVPIAVRIEGFTPVALALRAASTAVVTWFFDAWRAATALKTPAEFTAMLSTAEALVTATAVAMAAPSPVARLNGLAHVSRLAAQPLFVPAACGAQATVSPLAVFWAGESLLLAAASPALSGFDRCSGVSYATRGNALRDDESAATRVRLVTRAVRHIFSTFPPGTGPDVQARATALVLPVLRALHDAAVEVPGAGAGFSSDGAAGAYAGWGTSLLADSLLRGDCDTALALVADAGVDYVTCESPAAVEAGAVTAAVALALLRPSASITTVAKAVLGGSQAARTAAVQLLGTRCSLVPRLDHPDSWVHARGSYRRGAPEGPPPPLVPFPATCVEPHMCYGDSRPRSVGWTPLEVAIASGSVPAVRILLRSGAPASAPAPGPADAGVMVTALHQAVAWSGLQEVDPGEWELVRPREQGSQRAMTWEDRAIAAMTRAVLETMRDVLK